MKIATDFGRLECVRSVYNRILPVLHDPDVSEQTALEVQIIYRTECGDGFVPLSDLEHFAEVSRLTGKEPSYSRALLIGATACRRTGRYAEGLAFAARALEHATQHKLHSRGFEIINGLVLLHIAAGAFGEARKAFQMYAQYNAPSGNSKLRHEIYCNDARIALEENDLSRAVAAFDAIEKGSPTISVTRKGYYLALEVRIRLQEAASLSVLAPLLVQLEETHRQMRTMGSQDFEAYTLYLGLREIGQRTRAVALLKDYATDYRRSKWPLPNTILNALAADDISQESMPLRVKKGRHARSAG